MTPEKKFFRADARVLHEKASGGELGRKKKKRVFFRVFFRFSKKGTAVESIEKDEECAGHHPHQYSTELQ